MESPADSSYWVETEDWHTAGEPFRIVDKLPAGCLPGLPTVAQRRSHVIKTPGHPLDELRKSLCHEPRGHADMYGGFITPPDDAGAHLGVLFWHKDGFSTACGHGTIALGYWAVSHGIVAPPEGDGAVDVVVDVPSGRVLARVHVSLGKPVYAEFINVTSFQLGKSVPLAIPSCDTIITLDLAFGGAVYAMLDASQVGLTVEAKNTSRFIQLGREIKALLGTKAHYGIYDCYGVIFFEEHSDSQNDSNCITQRNVAIFADGSVDRSPCGSGTCARAAVLFAQGRLRPGYSKLVHRSIIGSQFEADIVSEVESPVQGFRACVPRVKGQANLVGSMKFFIDPDDVLFPGFLLR
ncbi:Trans-L-3-hydroxyproline dehydratase [Purpureocillium takamizusanense]|uniref:trans-L-3-hydroxyproline dehydratase n=1 Tax=Purpureocillium takamizusanense TaxID=2060973 RepID=A0A9Q8V9P7_9HYPO|nr:Trans-L-3-hydroxyproline dehydratase [Purpureocillium takamizusanense]UNI16926.1 Trans-L-3-hydroxyproline dehydratase [Purpureocillium takamizusanense]